MAKRERRTDRLPEGWFKSFIDAYDIKTTDDIKSALADLVGGTVETMLQAELEADLGYAKNDSKNKVTDHTAGYAVCSCLIKRPKYYQTVFASSVIFCCFDLITLLSCLNYTLVIDTVK